MARESDERRSVLTSTQRTVLSSVVDTFAPPDSDAAATYAFVAAAIDRLPPHRRDKLALVLGLLGSPLAGLALAGRPRGFTKLNRASREGALLRLAALPPLRPAFDALARLSLFAAYAVADEAGHSAVWDRIGYPGPRNDLAAIPGPAGAIGVDATPNERIEADAVVVGSGAGGGVAAALLARAGLRVVVLEAGPPFGAVAARQREAEAFGELYLDAGLAATDDLAVSILAGACVGGGTTVNWSTSLRLPPALAASWGETLGRPDFARELGEAYDAVEARLGVTVASEHNRNNAVIVDGCAKLGWAARAIPRNADCAGDRCGYCGFGCAYDNKRSTPVTYLRDALDAGASVYANTRVVCVRTSCDEHGNAVAIGVDAVTAGGNLLAVDAPLIVVAAGSLRTPGILARSGVTSPHLGQHLHLHPTSALSAAFDEPIEAWHGTMQSALCPSPGSGQALEKESPSTSSGPVYGAVIEAAPAHPGLMALGLPWTGRDAHAETMNSARYRASLIALTRDRGEGNVGLDERADVRYRIADDDARHLADGLSAAARIAFAAGARSVSTLHADTLTLNAEDATEAGLDAFASTLLARARTHAPLQLFSAHQMGTARMGATADAGAVDPDGRVYGVEGLLVTDASAFPSASGVNPMLTIMALAHRATSAFIARRAASSTLSPTASPARSSS
jgi:choline dehydrogenase-like flavoprotein